MKLEEGKFYRTRDGRKVGPMRDDWKYGDFKFHVTNGILNGGLWDSEGNSRSDFRLDLVSLWRDETPPPIQSKTVKTVEPGEYGRVTVKYRRTENTVGDTVCVGVCKGDAWCLDLNASELRAAALVFTQLAEFLEEKQDEA